MLSEYLAKKPVAFALRRRQSAGHRVDWYVHIQAVRALMRLHSLLFGRVKTTRGNSLHTPALRTGSDFWCEQHEFVFIDWDYRVDFVHFAGFSEIPGIPARAVSDN